MCRRRRSSSLVESGRRDGSDCDMRRLVKRSRSASASASAVVTGRRRRRRSRRRVGRGKGATAWNEVAVGSSRTAADSGCTVGGCCCSGSTGAAAEV